MIVDVHNHAFPEPVIALLSAPNDFGIRVNGATVSSGSHADHQLFPALHDPAVKLAELDARGLEGAVLSIAPRLFCYELPAELGEEMCAAANRGLREMAEHDPSRLRWMGHVPLADPERAAAMVGEVAAAGAVGLEIATAAGPGARLDDEAFAGFWAAVEVVGLPVLLHPAYIAAVPGMGVGDFYLKNVIGNPLETTICVERLLAAGVLDRHPGLRLILSHGGGFFPYQAGRLRHAKSVRAELADAPADPWAYAGRLVFDTITHDPRALAYLIERAGPENVAIGTDHPYDMGDPDPLGTLRAAVGDDDQAFTTVAEGTPKTLFGAVGVTLSVGVVATWVPKAGREDEVGALLAELQAASRREEGCLAYELHRVPDGFLLYEQYVGPEAIERHHETPHYRALVLGRAPELLARRDVVRGEVL